MTRWTAVAVLGAMMLWAAAPALACPEAKKARLVERLDLNRATRTELMKLEGVDAAMADRIIAYRAAHGPFRALRDLEKVPKVGRGVVTRNAGRLVVR